MRRALFFIFFQIFICSVGLGQASVLDQKVSIKLSGQTIETALQSIQKASRIVISYNQNILPGTTISQSFTDERLEAVLKSVLADSGLTFKVIGQTIAIVEDENAVSQPTQKPTNVIVSGHIYNKADGETLIGASVYDPVTNVGTISNVYGFYSLSLPTGRYDLTFSYLGYGEEVFYINLIDNATLDVELEERGISINEVVITAEVEKFREHTTSTEMGTVEMGITEVKSMPALLGEVDIIKAVQLLPGVNAGTEGSSGFSVRGGNLDQNLVILDEAPVYSPSHVLGFFSAFNPDAIKDMKLYKGDLPAKYGGRLASVLDIRMKDGNAKKFAASGGIGTTMSRLTLESPISDKGSIMMAGRRSYLDVLARGYNSITSNSLQIEGDAFYFYDFNLKGNYRIDNKNRLYLSGYFGRDVLSVNDDDGSYGFLFGNGTSSLRWNHIFSPKVFSNFTYYYSNYSYKLNSDKGGEAFGNSETLGFDWTSDLTEHGLKADIGVYLNPNNTLHFGAISILRNLDPGEVTIINNEVTSGQTDLQENRSIETAVYASYEQSIGRKLKVDYGLRLSLLQNIGPYTETIYDVDYNVVNTINHEEGVYNHFLNLEPRLMLRYQVTPTSSVKVGYSRNNQYIQQAAVGNFSTPFDIWFTSSSQVWPQTSDQFSAGYFRTLAKEGLELSAEIYYRDIDQTIEFKDNPDLILNENLEAELRAGIGRSAGLELMAKKGTGVLTGWVSYTFSRTQKKIADLNNGEWFNAQFDRPHNLSIVSSYALSKRVSLSGNFIYTTGSPVTLPTGRFEFENTSIPIYSNRNGVRLPDYHRLDVAVTLKGKKNDSRRLQTEWVFSIYNLYNRRNAFAIFPEKDLGNPRIHTASQRALFGIIPSFTFNAKF